jgi:biopolymer transport protein ExbD
MKKQISKTIGCLATALALAGCTHSSNQTAQMSRQHQVAIGISRDGALTVDGAQCRQNDLAARLTEFVVKQPTVVVVRAAPGTPFKKLAGVMDASETAGVQQVSLATAK